MARNEDDQIRRYVERLAAFELDGDAPLDGDALREIAAQVGVSDAAMERAAAAALAHRMEGAKALQRGELDTAVVALQSAIELAPADHVALSLLGDALRRRWHQERDARAAVTEREAARRVLLRAQALHWTPENDTALAELDGPQRPPAKTAADNRAFTKQASGANQIGGPAALPPKQRATPTRARVTPVVVAASLGVVVTLAAIVVLVRDVTAPTADETLIDGVRPLAPTLMAPTRTEPTPDGPTGTPVPSGGEAKGAPVAKPHAAGEVKEALPWAFDAPGLPGLVVDGGGALRHLFRLIPGTFRLDVWLRWQGEDALTGLSVSFDLLDASGDVVRATTANVIQDFHPQVRPGDLIPVHVQPMIVNDEQLIASARLRVVAAQHAPLETLPAPQDVPISWVARVPAGVKLRATVRAKNATEFGSATHKMRSHQADIELRNEGTVAVKELQMAPLYRSAGGEPVHQGDNDTAVASYLPQLRPGDVRVFRTYESGLPAWSSFELAVQAIQVEPAP